MQDSQPFPSSPRTFRFLFLIPIRSVGSTVIKATYGYSTQMYDDPLVKIAEKAMQGFSEASEPGAFMVDRFPFRKRFPFSLSARSDIDSEAPSSPVSSFVVPRWRVSQSRPQDEI